MTTPVATLRRVPTQRRAADRIQRILDAADGTLATEGTLGTKQVAAAAGISIGSLYHWFPDKESIALALARRHWSQLAAIVADLAAEVETDPGEDPIGATLGALVEGFRARPGFLALWFGELRTEALRAATRPARDEVAASVQRILAAVHPDAANDECAAVARVATLLGDGILREAFRVDPAGDPELLREGTWALRAYVAARLGTGDG